MAPNSSKRHLTKHDNVFQLLFASGLLSFHCPKKACGQFQFRAEEPSKLHGQGCGYRKEKESVAIFITYHKLFPDGRKHGEGEAFVVTQLESDEDRI